METAAGKADAWEAAGRKPVGPRPPDALQIVNDNLPLLQPPCQHDCGVHADILDCYPLRLGQPINPSSALLSWHWVLVCLTGHRSTICV